MNKESSKIELTISGLFNLLTKLEKAISPYSTFLYRIKRYNNLFTNIFSIFVYGG